MSGDPCIKEFLSYDPISGFFTWVKVLGGRTIPGSIAGTETNRGYIQLKFNGKYYLAHRLAFFFMTGSFPAEDVDHVNGVTTDNRFFNLRLATTTQNLCNTKVRSDSNSGIKGITYIKENKTWRAKLSMRGKTVFQKNFKFLEDACKEIKRQREIHHGEFARHE